MTVERVAMCAVELRPWQACACQLLKASVMRCFVCGVVARSPRRCAPSSSPTSRPPTPSGEPLCSGPLILHPRAARRGVLQPGCSYALASLRAHLCAAQPRPPKFSRPRLPERAGGPARAARCLRESSRREGAAWSPTRAVAGKDGCGYWRTERRGGRNSDGPYMDMNLRSRKTV
eukprot:2527146-Rhodomonas_salina.2